MGLLRKVVADVRNLAVQVLAVVVGLVVVALGLVLLVAVAWGVRTGWLWKGDGSSGVTVYPVMTCGKLCPDVTSGGKKVGRFRLPLGAQTFRGLPERQDVIKHSDFGVESLTRDRHFTCTVMTPKIWECRRVLSEDPYRDESYKMENGDLTYYEMPFNQDQAMQFVPWCMWQQAKWHNARTEHDDVGYVEPTGPRMFLGIVVFLATGCTV